MSNSSNSDPKRDLLRHTLATLAYRGGKAFRNAPRNFSEFRAGEGVRTPGEILAHLGDLFDWTLSIAQGNETWNAAKPLAWEKEVERFFEALRTFDAFWRPANRCMHRRKISFKARSPMRSLMWVRLPSCGGWQESQ